MNAPKHQDEDGVTNGDRRRIRQGAALNELIELARVITRAH